jgi:diadenosine tetraphosphate (Ap4A) HIT family hydrolase
MPLEHLWAGWRYDYVSQATDAERAEISDGSERPCVFCRIAAEGEPSQDNGVVWRGQSSLVVLNLYPYASGHMLVMPLRHIAELSELTEDEAAEVWAATRAATAALNAAYDADGMNIGANLGRAAGAGIPAHLHLHVLPRWSGDTNFMTSIAGVRVIPEPLSVAWEKLSAAWPR